MEWLERLNEAVTYIEDHLDEDVQIGAAAKIACCSTFHFQRMFSYIAGVPLSEYIRRRRMTCAALKLQRGEAKVIDLALMYGYEPHGILACFYHDSRYAAVGREAQGHRAQSLSASCFPYHN